MIYSLEIEKRVLGGLIKNPEVFCQVEPFLTLEDFYNDSHATIFCVLRDCIYKKEKIDKVVIAQKIKNNGISLGDDIDIFDYIDAISFTQINEAGIIEACKELAKVTVRRNFFLTGKKIQEEQKLNGNKTIDEIIGEADALYSEQSMSVVIHDTPQNIFKDIDVFVEERGNAPIEDNGMVTPYPEFNRFYGGLRPKNLYAFVARPGQGKSTLLFDISFKSSQISGFKTKVLYLDTEMEHEDIKWRAVASITGVPMWYLETGNWRKFPEMIKKVRPALEVIKDYYFDHKKIGNKTIDQICAIARRWRYSIGKDCKAIIVYDYVKLTGEKISESWKEYQAIGDKIDKLKKLSEELEVPLLTACQLNRSGESRNKMGKDVTDDSSAIAASDRLQWYASFVGIFRAKTLDEIAEDTTDFGTHKLIQLKTRFQGKDAQGFSSFVKRKTKDGTRFVFNYLNFELNNFNAVEKGSLFDIVKKENSIHAIEDGKEKDSGEL